LSEYLPLPQSVKICGAIMAFLGMVLQILTALRLGKRIAGFHELTGREARLETGFPFDVCRHPTYLSHSMMFFGSAVMTGYLSLFLIALVDLCVALLVIIPIEEKDLKRRFGSKYEVYSKRTNRFFPGISRLLGQFFRNWKHP